MRNLKPSIFALTLLLLYIHSLTALPLVPAPMSFRSFGHSIAPLLLVPGLGNTKKNTTKIATTPVRKRHVYGNDTSLIQRSPPKLSKGTEKFLDFFDDRHHHKNSTKNTVTTTPATNDGDDDDGKKKKKKKTSRRSDEKHNNDDVPLVRIFPNGDFSPFTPKETIEFYILQTAQGQKPNLAAPRLEYPAPQGIEPDPKPSKEGSVYDQSRTCDSSGQWCNLPLEGSVLVAGIGIGSCTYFKDEGLWGKTVTYLAC